MNHNRHERHIVTLHGLDGANPLAFLAALGAFRSARGIAAETGEPYMGWSRDGGVWRPFLSFDEEITGDYLVDLLHANLSKMAGHSVLTFSPDLRIPVERHRKLANQAIEDWFAGNDVISHEFLAAFGSDAVVDDKGLVEDTALRTMSGGGHQHFLQFMNDLARETNRDQLREALFGPWRYADPAPSLRVDPLDDRRYALRWKSPGSDAIRTVRGANRLAVEGIPFLYTAPAGSRLATCGFTGHRSNNTYWTWPIWDEPLDIDTVRSLLASSKVAVAGENSLAKITARMGISAVFRSQRITVGKYRNFTPAVQIA